MYGVQIAATQSAGVPETAFTVGKWASSCEGPSILGVPDTGCAASTKQATAKSATHPIPASGTRNQRPELWRLAPMAGRSSGTRGMCTAIPPRAG
ncbi:hypothetical protein ASD37_11735 [Mycobacterium sp. Root135]|nr:hypothetical protein ASD37_11735 [Mycobacterium sp. Root135]